MEFENQELPNEEGADVAEEMTELSENISEGGEAENTPKAPSGFDAAFDWIELFMVYFSIGLFIILCLFRHSPVVGSSMEQTLHQGDILIVSQFMYTPECGDIIVCQSEVYGLEKPLVKRIIATSGQTVSIDYENWKVTVDGETLDEDYVNFEQDTVMKISDYLPDTFTVPEGMLFVMGDNRNHSADSRSSAIGFIDERYVLGKVKLKLYPFSDIEYYA